MAKKGKKDSKPLTEEEKLVRQEMLALQAEEERKKQEEDAKKRLKDKKETEEKYARINGLKIHTQWRKFMRQAKVDELRRDIEILSQQHEREVDRKDAIIQMLDKDLDDAESQHQTALRAHLQTVDAIIELQYERIKALEAEFQKALQALSDEFDSEKAEIQNSHNKQKKELLEMAVAMEAEFEEAEGEARQEFESQREEIKNRNSEEYNVLKISLEGAIEELEREFEQAHQAYLDSTESRTQSFKELTAKDASSAKIIEQRMRKLIRLHEQIAQWRTKMATSSREWEQRNKALKDEKDMMVKHYQELKSKMNRMRQAEHERLKQLSLYSGEAIKELERKLEQAERILKLAELNRKMETEQEKILPFDPTHVSTIPIPAADELLASASLQDVRDGGYSDAEAPTSPLNGFGSGRETEALAQAMRDFGGGLNSADGDFTREESEAAPTLCAYATDENGKLVPEWHYLSNFFKRYNKVILDKAALDKEKRRLLDDNAKLKYVLKQYLDGITVNGEVLKDPKNPLLVVNNRRQNFMKTASMTAGLAPKSVNTLPIPSAEQSRRNTAMSSQKKGVTVLQYNMPS
ncbi:hypothetical protein KFL_000350250 [Klebsormidium nitens]|uniref:Dynein regulatory complex subunit 2 n=1 Tax=Klebsormidium nitens TaxID=105231 RepID=A0A1Y1HRQ0_KLENI|nr:hypothetical protein KFL_000350250 [Klebsormidium nitens]|eukprot:GAQ79671.1 hypothetical protein KFL_000350250 [Klebsormidium nitens]